MGFRLKITLRSERRFVVLSRRPVDLWCPVCGEKARFVDEEAEAGLRLMTADAANVHRIEQDGRKLICLNSVSSTA